MMCFSKVATLYLFLFTCNSLRINNFSKDLLCDLTERMSKGCSMVLTSNLSLIQCLSLCARNASCIGASLDIEGMCFIHHECGEIRFCVKEDTSHHYMSKYCGAWNPSTQSCSQCIHSSCHARSCTEWKERGLENTTDVLIDPDGPGEGTCDPEVVLCEMTKLGGVGVTVIGHDKESRTHVRGYGEDQSYRAVLNYTMDFQQVISLVELSRHCRQYIKWECYHSLMFDTETKCTGWINRTRQFSNYFGGASPGSYSCTCGMNNTCVEPELSCNCNLNKEEWQQDEGYLTYKNDLPMYAFVAGDTEDLNEQGYHVIGPLECWGTA